MVLDYNTTIDDDCEVEFYTGNSDYVVAWGLISNGSYIYDNEVSVLFYAVDGSSRQQVRVELNVQ